MEDNVISQSDSQEIVGIKVSPNYKMVTIKTSFGIEYIININNENQLVVNKYDILTGYSGIDVIENETKTTVKIY